VIYWNQRTAITRVGVASPETVTSIRIIDEEAIVAFIANAGASGGGESVFPKYGVNTEHIIAAADIMNTRV
jgi:hypothetical protein